jgi:hypothetical protein
METFRQGQHKWRRRRKNRENRETPAKPKAAAASITKRKKGVPKIIKQIITKQQKAYSLYTRTKRINKKPRQQGVLLPLQD